LKLTKHIDKLNFIDIGLDETHDVFTWKNGNARTFPVDILHARRTAVKDIYYHDENREKRFIFIKKDRFIFTLSSKPTAQFQLLEAILDDVADNFIESYQDYSDGLLNLNSTKGFASLLPEIFEHAVKKSVKWIMTKCFVCKKNLKVCVKRSLIDNAKSYPVALVYFHEGHGLLIYIDSSFYVRGAELVQVSG
jgi:hypothetical protein